MMCEKRICPAPGGQDGVGSPHTERALSARLRGLLALAMCLCLTLALLPAPAQAAETPEGNWSSYTDITWHNADNSNFTISTAAQLAGLAKLVNEGTDDFLNKTVFLSANVDLSGHYWTGIGTVTAQFKGAFNGGGHTVSHVVMEDVGGQDLYWGLFGYNAGTISGVRVYDYTAIIKRTDDLTYGFIGGVVGRSTGTVQDCVVEQLKASYELSLPAENTGYLCLIGGLVGDSSGGTIENSLVTNISVDVDATKLSGVYTGNMSVAGISGSSDDYTKIENCFADFNLSSLNINGGASGSTHYLAGEYAAVSYCYYSGDTNENEMRGTECYHVRPEQIAGTSDVVIGAYSTYANGPSLMKALNNWVDAQGSGDYSTWIIQNGTPIQKVFLPPPVYIDVSGPLNDVTYQSATGDIETGMELEGQIQENVSLLSVTLPASIPFIVDVDGNGAFKRVLSATGTLANRSDVGVNITLTAVTDEGELLKKVALSLVPDPAPSGDKPQIALAVGTGKTDLLAALAAPTGGVPTTATLKVDGAAKPDAAVIGNDGDQFVVGLTLKVSKQQK